MKETDKLSSQWENTYRKYIEINEWFESKIADPLGLRYLKRTHAIEERKELKKKLIRMRLFLDYLGNPQDYFTSVHVTGTSGKGSVSTMISQILTASGFLAGLHTSPYTQIPNEKILINGQMLRPSKYTEYLTQLRELYDKYEPLTGCKPVYSELMTALVYWSFMKEKIDYGVVEVGIGGRFDSTNLLNTSVAVITNIGEDHLESLGSTRKDIAWHKAGIIKPHNFVVIGENDPEILAVISEEAQKQEADLVIIGRDFSVGNIRSGSKGTYFDLSTQFGSINNLYVGLKGSYQAINAGVAVVATQLLGKKENKKIKEEAVRAGLETITMPVRFEIVNKKPLVVLDGAHNPPKMQALSSLIEQEYPDKKGILVVGMIKTKDAASSLCHLTSHFDRYIITKPDVVGKPSFEPDELAETLIKIKPEAKIIALQDDAMVAVKQAISEANPDDLILVTGSIYMMAKVREIWYPKKQLLQQLEHSQ